MPRATVIVMDACGVGALPDADAYGDAGANTLGHLAERVGGLDLPTLQLSVKARHGLGKWAGEAIATFGLILTILGTVRHRPQWVPATVALYITAAYWFTSSTSFANPAVTVARALTDSFAGIRPSDVPAFILAQLAGALAASLIAGWLFAEPGKERRVATTGAH